MEVNIEPFRFIARHRVTRWSIGERELVRGNSSLSVTTGPGSMYIGLTEVKI